MKALVTVNGKDLPEPSTYSAVTSTIVDSGRNVQGKVVGAVIRHDLAKVELGWKYLTVKQWASVLGEFTRNFYCTVTFFNQATGDYTTRTMYVSDRSAEIFRRDPETGEVLGWVSPRLSLVEV